ncbi:MAG: hypothetical protein E7258_03415 [Lachnospiraceae bacterium]|nr:hypothetical protein [Lachnospiraceae bacterium]
MRIINAIILSLVIFASYSAIKHNANFNRKVASDKKAFWAKESEANNVRRADISALDYIPIPLETLPIQAALDAGLNALIDTLKYLAEQKILNLSQYTNTELKLMYGPANLDTLSTCDEHYTNLIKTLNDLGVELFSQDKRHIAKAFLEYSISIGSDITATYVTLGTIYYDENDMTALDSLITKSEEITTLSGTTIKTKLNNIKSSEK